MFTLVIGTGIPRRERTLAENQQATNTVDEEYVPLESALRLAMLIAGIGSLCIFFCITHNVWWAMLFGGVTIFGSLALIRLMIYNASLEMVKELKATTTGVAEKAS